MQKDIRSWAAGALQKQADRACLGGKNYWMFSLPALMGTKLNQLLSKWGHIAIICHVTFSKREISQISLCWYLVAWKKITVFSPRRGHSKAERAFFWGTGSLLSVIWQPWKRVVLDTLGFYFFLYKMRGLELIGLPGRLVFLLLDGLMKRQFTGHLYPPPSLNVCSFRGG